MSELFTMSAILSAGFIFVLRVVDMALGTLRFMLVMRGRLALGWVLGFTQSIIFVAAISTVLQNLDNILHMIGYAAGFATGNVLGVWIEGKLAVGHAHVRVISPKFGVAIAERLREEGYALTEVSGRGRDGVVTLLNVSVLRKDINKVRDLVTEVDEEAFLTSEDLRPVRRGYWRS